MKFSSEPFVITKNYAEELRDKINRFRDHTRTRKALQLVLVTAYGVKDNAYASDLVDRTVTLSDLMSYVAGTAPIKRIVPARSGERYWFERKPRQAT